MVSQFKKDRFPLIIRTIWKRIWINPPKTAIFLGKNIMKGAISSTKWFPKTSNLCHSAGKKCKKGEKIFGIGYFK